MVSQVDSVRRVADILNEISSASQEQSAGIEQVNEAITQMDTVTQQNAALVEQAAATVFKLGQRVAPVAAVAAAPVASDWEEF